jgi:hypothetical protein
MTSMSLDDRQAPGFPCGHALRRVARERAGPARFVEGLHVRRSGALAPRSRRPGVRSVLWSAARARTDRARRLPAASSLAWATPRYPTARRGVSGLAAQSAVVEMSRSASVSVARLRSGFPGVSSSTSSVASARELDRDEDLLERLNVEIANVVTRLRFQRRTDRSASITS